MTSPSATAPARIAVLRKIITHERGQKLLHAEHRYLFYVTNTAHPAVRCATPKPEHERLVAADREARQE